MTFTGLYQNLNENYQHKNIADLFEAITSAEEVAINQIVKHININYKNLNTCDISNINKFIKAEKVITQNSQDLFIAHCANACISTDDIIKLTKTKGKNSYYISYITTTYDSFPQAQKLLAEFIEKNNTLSNITGHYYKDIIKNSKIDTDYFHTLKNFAENNFQIIEHQRIKIPFVINNYRDLIFFVVEGTWFLNALKNSWIPKKLITSRLKKISPHILQLPYKDVHIIDIFFAKGFCDE